MQELSQSAAAAVTQEERSRCTGQYMVDVRFCGYTVASDVQDGASAAIEGMCAAL